MNVYILLGLIIVIILFVYFFYLYNREEYLEVTGKCGIKYQILSKINGQLVADTLCELNRRCVRLIRILEAKYGKGGPSGSNASEHSVHVYKLLKEYDNDDFIENKTETFVINKGQKINLCVVDDTGKVFDVEFLMFVVLHELTHIITETFNHTPEFWRNNIWIMSEASQAGVYKPINYAQAPVKYCDNLVVDNNPMFDYEFRDYINDKNIMEKFKYADLSGIQYE